ncbi:MULTISPECIES: hypothetical protein [Butyricimonas]|uniref:hypothetical protein n=1 Tax=Butyricimonas TaxID=574697 RepID=UPI0016524D27|nr:MULTISPECIES: hypothetical protein [Butyricimonas]
MNKIYFLIICCMLGICVACNLEENNDVRATDLDLDYFVVSDDYDNPVDSLRYEIFEKYGVPVYYDDTIGVYDRGEKDRNGNPVLFYRVIRPPYSITDFSSRITWTEVEDISVLIPVLEALLHHTFEVDFPMDLLPRSLYLVNTMRTSESSEYYASMETGLINITGRGNDIVQIGRKLRGDMGGGGLERYKSQEIAPFYTVSLNLGNLYARILPNINREDGREIYHPGDEPMKFGFLRYIEKVSYDFMYEYADPQYESFWHPELGYPFVILPNTLERYEDLADFVDLVANESREDVYAKYAEWPLVIEKYEIISKIWDNLK